MLKRRCILAQTAFRRAPFMRALVDAHGAYQRQHDLIVQCLLRTAAIASTKVRGLLAVYLEN
jgi:hypothetical protein